MQKRSLVGYQLNLTHLNTNGLLPTLSNKQEQLLYRCFKPLLFQGGKIDPIGCPSRYHLLDDILRHICNASLPARITSTVDLVLWSHQAFEISPAYCYSSEDDSLVCLHTTGLAYTCSIPEVLIYGTNLADIDLCFMQNTIRLIVGQIMLKHAHLQRVGNCGVSPHFMSVQLPGGTCSSEWSFDLILSRNVACLGLLWPYESCMRHCLDFYKLFGEAELPLDVYCCHLTQEIMQRIDEVQDAIKQSMDLN